MSWNNDDEMKLINLIKNNKKYDEISIIMNRDKKTIIVRLQKIIYENKNGGKSFEIISNITGLPIEDVMYNYYEYKKLLSHNITNENNKNNENNKQNDKSEFEKKMSILEKENKFIKLILENKELHKKLNDLIDNNKMNKNILDILKNMRKK